MFHKKSLLVVVLLISCIVFGAAIMPQQQPPAQPPAGVRPAQGPQEPFTGYKNLKVLPKNISKEDLEKTMRGFRMALGVQCTFCHARVDATPTVPAHNDFTSDAKPEKTTARHMLKMLAAINKKYFKNEKDEKGAVVALTCKSCHNGKQKPDMTM